MSSALLELINISKDYEGSSGSHHNVLSDINLKLYETSNEGYIVTLIGRVNSGRSTLLKIISGIESQTSGTKKILGEEYNSADGRIIYIPEKPSSLPWLNVRENIEFVLEQKKITIDKTIVEKIINDVELTGYENHLPDDKSPGFRFRISLARALAVNPKIILLDEPFLRMSTETKSEIFSLLKSVCKNYQVAFILATINIIDSFILSKILFLLSRDTGTIFDKMDVELGNSTLHSPLKDEKFLDLLNRVELKLREKNINETITFSV